MQDLAWSDESKLKQMGHREVAYFIRRRVGHILYIIPFQQENSGGDASGDVSSLNILKEILKLTVATTGSLSDCQHENK